MRYLRIERFEGDTAVLTALPGHREVLAIATPARLEPIAAELTTLRGQRTRCVIAAPEASASRPAADGGAEAAASGPGPFDRRAAMQVPLVRQVLEYFPDALLLEAREESAQEAASESGADAADASESGDDSDRDD